MEYSSVVSNAVVEDSPVVRDVVVENTSVEVVGKAVVLYSVYSLVVSNAVGSDFSVVGNAVVEDPSVVGNAVLVNSSVVNNEIVEDSSVAGNAVVTVVLYSSVVEIPSLGPTTSQSRISKS